MSSWTDQFKHPIDYLLMETGDHLLQESNGFLILEQTGTTSSSITNVVKH